MEGEIVKKVVCDYIDPESAIERHGESGLKKVYISGAITGIDRLVYLTKFRKTERRLREMGYAVVNPAIVCDHLPEMKHGEYLDICLTMLKYCDYIYVIDGEGTSKGVKAEVEYAESNGIETLEVDFDSQCRCTNCINIKENSFIGSVYNECLVTGKVIPIIYIDSLRECETFKTKK